MSGRKPKLLISVGEFIEGAGQSRVVNEEVRYLSDRYRITIVADSIRWSSPIEASLEDIGDVDSSDRGAGMLRRIISSSDLVHCHDSLKMMATVASMSKPWVVTSHGIAPIRLRSTASNKVKGAVTQVAYPLLYRRATELVAISPYIKEWLARNARRNAVLIPNGAPPLLDSAKRQKPSTANLLYVGEISRRKGITDLVRAASLLPVGSKMKLAGVGDIAQFRDTSDGTGASVEHFGLVSDAHLQHLYQSATCLISASFWEGYGLPVVEGFSYGTPALVRNSTNLRNLVLDSQAGRLFDEVNQIPRLFDEILHDWEVLSANALNYARSHSWVRTFDEYHQLFSGLLQAN